MFETAQRIFEKNSLILLFTRSIYVTVYYHVNPNFEINVENYSINDLTNESWISFAYYNESNPLI